MHFSRFKMSTVSTYSNCVRTILMGGLSAAIYFSAGVACFYFYKKHRDRNKGKNRRPSKDCRSRSASQENAKLASETEESGCEKCEESDSGATALSLDAKGGAKRHCGPQLDGVAHSPEGDICKSKFQENSSTAKCHVSRCTDLPSSSQVDLEPAHVIQYIEDDFCGITESADLRSKSSERKEIVDEVERNEEKAENFELCSNSCDGEVRKTMCAENSPVSGGLHTKNECSDSPSVSSDSHSVGSQDSGKGASMGLLTSAVSPISELIELPPIYEFEVPQDIVGLIIGRKGTTIKYFTDESGAHIVIRHHYYSSKHKICTIEGTREQINKCLRLIRHKFPPSRFPELKLTPMMPPPVVAPHSPVFDAIINLGLPEGVGCEVVLSSMVDAGRFFVQQPTHPTFPSLARLDQYMLAVYNQPAGVPALPTPIDIGIICAAPVLAGWYRAQTFAFYEETNEVMVKFVDYGGYSKISASDLRQIRSDFMNLSFQAIECCLAHVKPIDEEEGWSQEANSFFEQCVHGKVAEAFALKSREDSLPEVELHCLIDDEMTMVNRLLADKGFATWCPGDDIKS